MNYRTNLLVSLTVICGLLIIGVDGSSNPFQLEASICKLLRQKFSAATPWLTYPILYEPIHRGRLTIWSGMTNLPTSNFECNSNSNATDEIILDFDSYATKLEWTFFDKNKGNTYHGLSIEHREDSEFRIFLNNNQEHNYLECNTVARVEKEAQSSNASSFRTICSDCPHSILSLINGQLQELIESKLNDQILDNLRWHLSQLISNHHFSGPLTVVAKDFNRV